MQTHEALIKVFSPSSLKRSRPALAARVSPATAVWVVKPVPIIPPARGAEDKNLIRSLRFMYKVLNNKKSVLHFNNHFNLYRDISRQGPQSDC